MGTFGINSSNLDLKTNTNISIDNSNVNSPKIVDVEVGKFSEQDKINYLIGQGYTPEEAKKIIANNPQITSFQDLSEFVNKQKKTNIPQVTDKDKKEQPVEKPEEFSFKEFNKLDLKSKATVLADEYAKNQNLDTWDGMTDNEKLEARKISVNNVIKKYNKLNLDITYDKIEEYLNNPELLSKLPEDKRIAYENVISELLLDLKVANENKLSLDEFYGDVEDEKNLMTDSMRSSRKYEYIDNLYNNDRENYDALNDNIKNAYNAQKVIIAADVSDIIQLRKDAGEKISEATITYRYLQDMQKEDPQAIENDPVLKNLYNFYQDIDSKCQKSKIGKPSLATTPNFNFTNKSLRLMAQSEVYQRAYKDAKDKVNVEHPQNGNDYTQLPEYQAMLAYTKDRLSKAKTKEERIEILKNLTQGFGLNEMYLFGRVKEQLKSEFGGSSIHTDLDAMVRAHHDGSVNSDDYRIAYDSGSIENKYDTSTYVVATMAKYAIKNEENIKQIQRFAPMDHELINEEMVENGCPEEVRDRIGYDAVENIEKYEPDARENKISQLGYYFSEIRGKEVQNELKTKIIELGDEGSYKAFASSASSYKGSAQISLADNVMSMANYFSDEANIRAQSALANDVQNCDVENQLEIHSTIMNNSKYDEVLELASSNIHNYDPSVQSDAIRVTYATGNQAAISACEAQLNQCSGVNASESTYANYVQNQSTAQNINEALASGDSQKLVQLVLNNSLEITKYLSSCSQKDKEIFVENFCKAATESQLLNFIKNNKGSSSMLELVMKYSNGKVSKGKLFGAFYDGQKGNIAKLLNILDIKGAEVINLAESYKEHAPDIALAVDSSELARMIITNPEAWGYQMGRAETEKLQQLASHKELQAYNNDTTPETAISLRDIANKYYLPEGNLFG